MAQIGINIVITGLTGKLIIRWKKPPSPAEVGRNANPSTITFPVDQIYVIPNLAPVVYTVELWRSDDGIALDQLIKAWSIDASTSSEATITNFQYKVGRGFTNVTEGTGPQVWADPENEDVALTDERLNGFTKDQLMVHQAGYGNLLDSEYNLLAGGGIELLDGKTFDQDVAWFITVAETVAVPLPGDPSTAAMFAGVEVVTANRDFFVSSEDNLYNKLVIANWAGSVGTITFPDLSLIPDDTHITFNTHGGSQKYLKLQFDAGDTVRFLNQLVNVIYVAKCQKISLYFHSGVCYVLDEPTNSLRRGTVLSDYDATRDADTGAFINADEATGVLSNTDYPGLYAFAAQLAGDAVCALGIGVGQWSYDSGGGVFPNKRKYGIEVGTLTFRVPHLSGVTAKHGNTPGVYEADAVGAHSLTYDYKQGKSDDNESGVTGEYLRKAGAAGGSNYGNTSITYNIQTGVENKVKAYLQKPFIYL